MPNSNRSEIVQRVKLDQRKACLNKKIASAKLALAKEQHEVWLLPEGPEKVAALASLALKEAALDEERKTEEAKIAADREAFQRKIEEARIEEARLEEARSTEGVQKKESGSGAQNVKTRVGPEKEKPVVGASPTAAGIQNSSNSSSSSSKSAPRNKRSVEVEGFLTVEEAKARAYENLGLVYEKSASPQTSPVHTQSPPRTEYLSEEDELVHAAKQRAYERMNGGKNGISPQPKHDRNKAQEIDGHPKSPKGHPPKESLSARARAQKQAELCRDGGVLSPAEEQKQVARDQITRIVAVQVMKTVLASIQSPGKGKLLSLLTSWRVKMPSSLAKQITSKKSETVDPPKVKVYNYLEAADQKLAQKRKAKQDEEAYNASQNDPLREPMAATVATPGKVYDYLGDAEKKMAELRRKKTAAAAAAK